MDNFYKLEGKIRELITKYNQLKEYSKRLETKDIGGGKSRQELKSVINTIKQKVNNMIEMLNEIGV